MAYLIARLFGSYYLSKTRHDAQVLHYQRVPTWRSLVLFIGVRSREPRTAIKDMDQSGLAGQRRQTQKYVELSRYYIRQAEDELKMGDLTQASEKAWGAVACATKAIAVQRGWNHQRHDLLYSVSEQIADELGRTDLTRLFRSAGSLHNNFYENWMGEDHVRGGIQDVRTFLREMEAVAAAPPPRFVPQTSAQAARLCRLTSGC